MHVAELSRPQPLRHKLMMGRHQPIHTTVCQAKLCCVHHASRLAAAAQQAVLLSVQSINSFHMLEHVAGIMVISQRWWLQNEKIVVHAEDTNHW
jgi:DNA-binding IclR family transcriptional regulator